MNKRDVAELVWTLGMSTLLTACSDSYNRGDIGMPLEAVRQLFLNAVIDAKFSTTSSPAVGNPLEWCVLLSETPQLGRIIQAVHPASVPIAERVFRFASDGNLARSKSMARFIAEPGEGWADSAPVGSRMIDV